MTGTLETSTHDPEKDHPTTLADLIDEAAAELSNAKVAFGHGTTNARDEASWLVLWSLGLPLDMDIDPSNPQCNLPLNETDIDKAQALIQTRICTRKPAAYLTREAWLQGVPFYIDERAIVPRSLIAEVLVDGSIDYWLHDSTRKVLDLCTGNGSLAILAAMVFPDVIVTGSDLSPDALAVAEINVQKHSLNERVSLVISDGLASSELKGKGPFDLILCNPPYVNAQSMNELPAEYRAEPSMALDGNPAGGVDGMDFIRAMVAVAKEALMPRGILVLEIGNERAYFEAAFPMLEVVWLNTSAGEDQVLLITREALN